MAHVIVSRQVEKLLSVRMKRFWFSLWTRLRHLRTDADLEEEVCLHRELQIDDGLAAGKSRDEATRLAHLRLGSNRVIVERVRDEEWLTIFEGWYRDVLLGLRALRKSPVFSVTTILTIALGIGANTAIFTLLYGLLLRSLPVTRPERLVHVGIFNPESKYSDAGSDLPYRMLDQFRRQQHSLESVSAWLYEEVAIRDRDGTARLYFAGLVGGNGFSLLGMKPYIGRLIAPKDDVPGGPAEGWPAVLSYGFWNERFGADPGIVGRHLNVGNTPVTVVGVAAPQFTGVWPGSDTKIYLPLMFEVPLRGIGPLDGAKSFFQCSAIGRLKPGVTITQAQSEASTYWPALFRQFIPVEYQRYPFFQHATLRVASARAGLPTYFRYVYGHPLRLMQALVLAVLLLCCVNVGGLMMSKVYLRQREFAIRNAIGAARWRLIRQHLTESLVIALAGAALGGAGAWFTSRPLLYFFRDPMMGQPIAVHPDKTVFWVTGICAIAATLLFGTLPAWRAGRSDPGSLLKSRTAQASRRSIAGRAFVPLQVALSLVLVALATMLSQSLIHIRSERTGFELNHVTIQSTHFDQLPEKGNAKLDLYQRMVDRLDQMPGIRSAAVTWMTPMTGIQETTAFEAGPTGATPRENAHLPFNIVGPSYFQTMHTRILEGREFFKSERQPNVCILNQAAAVYFFSSTHVLGGSVRSKDTRAFPNPIACRVIGIAQDAKFANLREPPPPTIYFPLSMQALRSEPALVFLINAASKAQAIAGYRKMLSEIAPTMPLVIFATLKEQEDAALGSERLITAMSSLFAALALFLSALGLYGLLSASVAQRTSEIGVRIALGAQRANVLRMILSDALSLFAAGLILGAAALFAAVRLIQKMLYHVAAFDAITLTCVVSLLLAVTLAAALPPALRAASVDPMEALRAD